MNDSTRAAAAGVPLISVLLPVYNGARYLERAVQSVLDQTERSFELLVIDDGSTDGSLGILQRFAGQDTRVRLVTRENRGCVTTLNEMLATARGTFLARMDQDDIARPRRFEREVQALASDPSLVAVGCSVYFIDHLDRRLMTCDLPVDHQAIVDWVMAIERGNSMSHPAMMIRADAMAKIGGYREALWLAEDADLVLRLAEVGRLANLAEPLLSYRLHPQSVSQLHAARQRDAHYRCVVEAAERRGLPPPDESLRIVVAEAGLSDANRTLRWAWWALGSGNVSSARSLALDAVRQAPFSRASWHVMACAIRGH